MEEALEIEELEPGLELELEECPECEEKFIESMFIEEEFGMDEELGVAFEEPEMKLEEFLP